MVGTEKAVMNVLLKYLLDQGLIAKGTYGKAVDYVQSTIAFPEIFEYCVHSLGERPDLRYAPGRNG